jgi:peptidoglycan-associated lipoprotein
MMQRRGPAIVLVMVAILTIAVSCKKRVDPVVRPQPPAEVTETTEVPPPLAPPAPIDEPPLTTPSVASESAIGSKDLDALNRNSPLAPVFFGLDSYELSNEARGVLQASAKVLQQQPSWQITVEGHCDERGTAEYNLSLGERRALAAKSYLVSLGIAADRLRTVSYGKEFPFDPGHDDSAWAKNRRAHFVITAK